MEDDARYCRECLAYKPAASFKRDAECVGGRRPVCKDCASRRVKVVGEPDVASRWEGKEARMVFLSDQQVPFHDRRMHEKVLEFLTWFEPDILIIGGDTVDFNSISRYRRNPYKWSSVTEDITTAKSVLADYVDAAGHNCEDKRFVPGNHDQRFQDLLVNSFSPDMFDLAESAGLTLPSILGFDDLGIQYIEAPTGAYPQAMTPITPKLAAIHGWLARKGSGMSARASIEHLGYSVVMGHTHRQAMVFESKHEIDGNLRVICGVEAGCMCEVQGGLGYAVAPDWQQGFAVVHVHKDGGFTAQLAHYLNGKLRYNGEVW